MCAILIISISAPALMPPIVAIWSSPLAGNYHNEWLRQAHRAVAVWGCVPTSAAAADNQAEPPKLALSLPDKPSIAILPFTNLSSDPEQNYFADGMVEEIITALSHFRQLFVIARNSSFTYKGKAVDIKQVGRELGVRYVLEGSARCVGNRLRITSQLIETATGSHIWADRWDCGLTEEIYMRPSEPPCSRKSAVPGEFSDHWRRRTAWNR